MKIILIHWFSYRSKKTKTISLVTTTKIIKVFIIYRAIYNFITASIKCFWCQIKLRCVKLKICLPISKERKKGTYRRDPWRWCSWSQRACSDQPHSQQSRGIRTPPRRSSRPSWTSVPWWASCWRAWTWRRWMRASQWRSPWSGFRRRSREHPRSRSRKSCSRLGTWSFLVGLAHLRNKLQCDISTVVPKQKYLKLKYLVIFCTFLICISLGNNITRISFLNWQEEIVQLSFC